MDEHIEFLQSGPLSLVKRWGAKWSLWPVHLVTACCGVELAHAYACGYDGERLGSLNYGICRQTNLIIVEGAITRKMARVLRITWEQMPDPKFVIVMGACGLNGGLFWNGYHMVKPSDVVPVDYFIPGCPPTPEALLRGIRALQDKIMTGEVNSTAKFSKADLSSIIEIPEEIKQKRVPTPPHSIAKAPVIQIDAQKEVEWDEGANLIQTLKKDLEGLYISIEMTDLNRICLKTTPEKTPEIAERLKFTFDHVKSVNVVDVPNENKFIIEYVVSSYGVRDLMPILLSIITEIPRDNPRHPSLAKHWPSADYMEREMHEFFGVWFEDNLWMGRNFLLAPDTPEYPLRKDFKLPRETYVLRGDSR